MRINQPNPQELLNQIMTPSRIEHELATSGCLVDGNENIRANYLFHLTYEWHVKNTTTCEEFVEHKRCPDHGYKLGYPTPEYKCWENSPIGGKYVSSDKCKVDKGPIPRNTTICQVQCSRQCIGHNINMPCRVTKHILNKQYSKSQSSVLNIF